MTSTDPFYIRRTPVWGGGFHFCVARSDTRIPVSRWYQTRTQAKRRLVKMVEDHERFISRGGH